MKKDATMGEQVKRYLTKVLKMDALQTLGIIAIFILLHVAVICIIGSLITNTVNERPLQYKPACFVMNCIKRDAKGDLNFHYTDTTTNIRYVRAGIQWKNARTGRIVSAKTIGL